jgi:hypothetical protein
MSALRTIFLGVNPQPARNVVAEYVKNGAWTTFVQPFCGRFGLSEAIAKVTKKPENIWTSDICIFSATLGYWLSEQSLEQLEFKILAPEIQHLTKFFDGDVQQVAAVLLAIKFAQLKRRDAYYYQSAAREIARKPETYVAFMGEELKRLAESLRGIHFRLLDYKDEIREHMHNPEALIICDPPCYAKGYTRMFEAEGVYSWRQPSVPEFLPSEFEDLLSLCENAEATVLCMKYPSHELGKIKSWHAVASCSLAARELNKSWQFVSNKPFPVFAVRSVDKPVDAKYVCMVNDKVNRNSKVHLIRVDDDVALYYRDLLVHKLADSGGEENFLLLIDGKVAAVIGLMTNFFTRRGLDYVFLNYAIEVTNLQEPRLHKLVTQLIYSRGFKEQLAAQCSGLRNTRQFRDFNKMHSTKIGPTDKLWNMPKNTIILKKERTPNGLWKVLYEHSFSDKTFHQCVVEFAERKPNA